MGASWRRLFKNLTRGQRIAVIGMILLITATWLATCLILASLLSS